MLSAPLRHGKEYLFKGEGIKYGLNRFGKLHEVLLCFIMEEFEKHWLSSPDVRLLKLHNIF